MSNCLGLSTASNSIPIQLSLRPEFLYGPLNDLNAALESNSRKIPRLFRAMERLLAEILPTGLLKHLAAGTSPVAFFSDLPLEWTMLDEWPVCLTRPVSRIPIGFSHWDVLNAAVERSAVIDTRKPSRVLVFDLIEGHDPIRSYTDAFISTSEGLSHKYTYTYASPKNAREFVKTLTTVPADIVVLDAHGGYSHPKDELYIRIEGQGVPLDDLLPDVQVPPVWILSACHTSVTGAMRGCFVRGLLGRGAVSVVASLSRVDAFTASMFVGRLLTDIFSPMKPALYDNFQEAFFATQYTTALLYDPLLPIFRMAERDVSVKEKLAKVLSEFFTWTYRRELDIRKYRYEIAWFIGESLLRNGLQQLQLAHLQSGIVRPETLLFSVFGVPTQVKLRP